jgi:hypothetical protein
MIAYMACEQVLLSLLLVVLILIEFCKNCESRLAFINNALANRVGRQGDPGWLTDQNRVGSIANGIFTKEDLETHSRKRLIDHLENNEVVHEDPQLLVLEHKNNIRKQRRQSDPAPYSEENNEKLDNIVDRINMRSKEVGHDGRSLISQ